MIYRGIHITIDTVKPPYYNQVCKYLERLTPFCLYDNSDSQFVIYIPAHLAAIDEDGVKLVFNCQENFIDALKLHMSVFDRVKVVTGEMVDIMRSKMIER